MSDKQNVCWNIPKKYQDKNLSQLKINRLAISFFLAGLTACGGTTSPQLPDSTSAEQAAQLIIAPALGPQPVTETIDSVSEELSTAITPDTPLGSDQTLLTLLTDAADVSCNSAPEVFSTTMLGLINASRVEARMCGADVRGAVATLAWNSELAAAAELHSNDMASNNFFSHIGSDGLEVPDRADGVGYVWRAIGENIAAGQLDQGEVHQGWIDSAGHCRNIMNEVFTEVGAACVSDPNSDFGNYWTVVFGDAR